MLMNVCSNSWSTTPKNYWEQWTPATYLPCPVSSPAPHSVFPCSSNRLYFARSGSCDVCSKQSWIQSASFPMPLYWVLQNHFHIYISRIHLGTLALRFKNSKTNILIPTSPKQTLIKKILYSLAYSPNLWRHFLSRGSVLSDDSSLLSSLVLPFIMCQYTTQAETSAGFVVSIHFSQSLGVGIRVSR